MPLKKKGKKRPTKRAPLKKKKVQKRGGKKAVKAKKVVKKRAISKKRLARVEGKEIGIITHYFPHVMAAVVKLKAPLSAGDKIKIKGHTTDFTQNISSMQMDHAPMLKAKKGQEIGLQVVSRVRQHDIVYKI